MTNEPTSRPISEGNMFHGIEFNVIFPVDPALLKPMFNEDYLSSLIDNICGWMFQLSRNATDDIIKQELHDNYTKIRYDLPYKGRDILRQYILDTGGFYLSTLKGKLVNRICKFIKETYDIALPASVKEQLGNWIDAHKTGSHYTVTGWELTRDFSWDAGDFGDEDSCFWKPRSYQNYAQSRNLLYHHGAFALRFYTDINNRKKGIGRVFVFPEYPIPGANALFNIYGMTPSEFTGLMSGLFPQYTVKSERLTNKKKSKFGTLYLNHHIQTFLSAKKSIYPNLKEEAQKHLGNKFSEYYSKIGYEGEFYWDLHLDDSLCTLHQGNPFKDGKGNKIEPLQYFVTVEDFEESGYIRCYECGDNESDEDIIYVNDRPYCLSCRDDLFFFCESCDSYRSTTESTYEVYGSSYALRNGHTTTVCERCYEDHTLCCEECGRDVYQELTVPVEIEGHEVWCKLCADSSSKIVKFEGEYVSQDLLGTCELSGKTFRKTDLQEIGGKYVNSTEFYAHFVGETTI